MCPENWKSEAVWSPAAYIVLYKKEAWENQPRSITLVFYLGHRRMSQILFFFERTWQFYCMGKMQEVYGEIVSNCRYSPGMMNDQVKGVHVRVLNSLCHKMWVF